MMAAFNKVTVLKVKRKASEDPLHVVRIQCPRVKRAKIDRSALTEDSILFQLFESRTGEVNDASILEQIEKKKFKIQQPLICSYAAEDTPNVKKSFMKQKTEILTLDPCKITSRSSHLKSWNSAIGEKENGTNNKILVEIFGVTKDDAEFNNKENNDKDTNEIYCNSIKMIRENLKIVEDSEVQDEEFIYDLYCAHAQDFDSKLISGPLSDGGSLDVLEYDGKSDNFEESDSNDENHWKNDYPDEDLFYSSEDENSDDDSSSNSSNNSDYNHSRPRNFVRNYVSYYDDIGESYNFQVYDEDEDS